MCLKSLITFCTRLLAYCILCGDRVRDGHYLCLPCRQDLPILTQVCRLCARFLTVGDKCGHCLSSPPPYDGTIALFSYTSPITKLVTRLKFAGHLYCANFFAEAFLARFQAQLSLPDCIVPIPLHPARLRERGFNQALEIAKPLAKALHVPIDLSRLQRVCATMPQRGLTAKERVKNVRRAFASTGDFREQRIVLLDDVMTTGSTVTACARILKEQGAKEVIIWCIARRG